MQQIETLAIAGLGLLGGSIALAARERGIANRILAQGRRSYQEAQEVGLIDGWTLSLEEAAAEADLLILCTPVDKILEQLPVVMKAAKPGSLVTDVGSTKRRLVEAAETIDSDAFFVGSHPMVGSHLTGWKNAFPSLFGRGITYVTATGKTNTEAVARVGAFWEALDARTVYIDPTRHDYLCALLSHVPHMVAVVMVQLLMDSKEDPATLKLLCGSGLRDTTRIAMGSADVWTEICGHNCENVADLLDQYAELVQAAAQHIRSGNVNALHEQLESAAETRRQLNIDQ